MEGGKVITPGVRQGRCDFEWNSAQQQLYNTSCLFVLSLDLHISSLCEKIPFEEKQAWEEIKCAPSPSLQITMMALYYCTA